MKTYLALATVLGAIAIVSVSFLAQAEPKSEVISTKVTAPVAATGTATTTTTTTTTAPMTVDADKLAKDTAECTALSTVAKADGVMPTDEEKAAAVKSCLDTKGHVSAAEVTTTTTDVK